MEKSLLVAKAEDQMKKYPQYKNKNRFANTVLVKVKNLQKTRMGVAFDKDEITIAEPGIDYLPTMKKGEMMEVPVMTLWSFKNKCWTAVYPKNVEVI